MPHDSQLAEWLREEKERQLDSNKRIPISAGSVASERDRQI